MKVKIKNLDWLAGRPLIILNSRLAKVLNVTANDRLLIRLGKRKIYSIVDVTGDTVGDKEIGLSLELTKMIGKKDGEKIDLFSANESEGTKLVKKKLSGGHLTEKELQILIGEIVNNNLSESEIAFFIAAERANGMTDDEIYFLTKAMIREGKKISFDKKIVADKHCIGGIAGNRTTPLVISICAAAGLTMPKSSSRAITSAAGTADVIETISKVEFSVEEIKKIVKKTNACMVWGGALALAPSDDKIINIERILNLDVEPQLLASIMAKKISAGSNHVLIDIPYGAGKIKTKSEGKKLGKKFEKLGKRFKIKIKVVYTPGYKPIGRGIGPVLEMKDVLSVLKNEKDCPKDLKNKGIYLASEIMKLCGIRMAKSKAKGILASGKAYEKFREIIIAQNGRDDFDYKVKNLGEAKYHKAIYANRTGKIEKISNTRINEICRILGTPQNHKAGIYLERKEGMIKSGEKILTMYSESKEKLEEAERSYKKHSPIEIK
jgi:AMP phosphorylase